MLMDCVNYLRTEKSIRGIRVITEFPDTPALDSYVAEIQKLLFDIFSQCIDDVTEPADDV